MPGAIRIVDQQAIALRAQCRARTHHGFSGRALQEGTGLLVNRTTKKIVLRGVADVELDRGVEPCQLNQMGRFEGAGLFGGLGTTDQAN